MNNKTDRLSLTLAQKKAVEHKKGPMMVLAGPGSGKTFVLVEHIKYMTEQLGIRPEQILVITFTREAASEMKNRAEKKGIRPGVFYGTFHSAFFNLIRQYYGYGYSDIYDTRSCIKLIHDIMRRGGFLGSENFTEATTDMADYIFGLIGKIKNGTFYLDSKEDKELYGIYRAYVKRMSEIKKIDYDDMLLLCKKLLMEHPNILKELRNKYEYILVDEFQDINALQFDIVRMLAFPKNNLFIVGDDDQSIYGFRGSRPEIMLGFKKYYPDALQVLLDVNYRSTEAIVNASLKLISHNKNRYDKNLTANRKGGRNIRIEGFADEEKMIKAVMEEISILKYAGVNYSDTAVLFRVNNNAVKLATLFDIYEIPYTFNKKADDSVALMTFHASKGLEFNNVYIIYAVNGITPWKAATEPEEINEERRMFYVAMTRAKKQLHIFYTKRIYNVKRKKSIFVDEIM